MAEAPASPIGVAGVDLQLRDELHRRVGRNVLQLQKIERAWKGLLLTCVVEGAVAEGAAGAARWSSTVLRMNMGDVVKALFEEVLTAEPRERPIKGDRSKGTARTRLTFEPAPDDAAAARAMQSRWQNLVEERNRLVHHFVERWQRASPEELQGALTELDEQQARADTVLAETQPLLKAAATQREELARYFQSEAGQHEVLVGLTFSSTMDRLCRIAASRARGDGWTYQTTAHGDLCRDDPDGVRLLKEAFGSDWLPHLLGAAADVFEVCDEPVPNGGPTARRFLYRLRSD